MDYSHSRGSHAWNAHPRPISFVVHFLGIVSVALVLVWTLYYRGGINYNAANTNHIFNVHPFLMLLAFIFLASEAILIYKSIPGSKVFRKIVHLTLHLIALVLGIVGICAAFKYHNLNSIANLYSLHSWLGIVTIVLFGIQWLIGFVSFFFPGFAPSARASLLPWHIFFGLFIYGLAVATTELGFLEKLTFLQQSSTIAKFSPEAMLVNALGIIVAVLAGFVFIAAVLPHDHVGDDGYSSIE